MLLVYSWRNTYDVLLSQRANMLLVKKRREQLLKVLNCGVVNFEQFRDTPLL